MGWKFNPFTGTLDQVGSGGTGAVDSVNGQTGVVVLDAEDVLPSQTGNNGKFLTTDGSVSSWGTPAGSGNVVGPASATDNALARYDGTTGKLLQNSGVTVDDSGNIAANNLSGTNTGDQTLPVGGTPALTLSTTNSAGSSPNFLRRDDTILVFDATSPSTQAYGDSAVVGVASTAARRDHKHAMPATTKDTTANSGVLKGNGSVVSGGAVLGDLGTTGADFSMNSHKLTNVTDPSSAQDAATKAYVDAVAQGLSVKGSVRLATAAALPANTYLANVITITATGVLTIDGSTVALNDRILVKDESAQLENGVYICTTAGAIGVAAVLTRSSDMDTSAEFPGAFVFSEAGTVNTAAGFVCTNSTPPTVGTTAITFTQFSGAGEITAGAGLTKTANTIDAVGTTNRITVNADSIDISASYAGQNTITILGTIATGVWNGTIITSAYGGTGNGFTKFTGPASTEKTFTLPDASSTIVVQGGALGTPSSGTATNLTGTASGLTAGNVTTNANLTGVITSSGNATSIASQTGTGTKFVVDTSPVLVTPTIGAATATTVAFNGAPSAGTASGNIITLTSAQTQAIGDAVTINSSGQATLAKADAIANASGILIATTAVTGSGSNTYMLPGGVLRLSASASWTVGGLVYLSATGTTTNTLTQTAPSSTNNVIQPLGIALAVGTILFNPSLTQVEHT